MTAFNPETDLEITRELSSTPEQIWQCWSEPDLFRQWFTPAPVTIRDCTLELTPGGCFETTVEIPDGDPLTSRGCFLAVIPSQLIVFTDTLLAGFRPAPAPFMTVRITLLPSELGTLYHAHVMHASPEDREEHAASGFETGWNTALDQLEALTATLNAPPLF